MVLGPVVTVEKSIWSWVTFGFLLLFLFFLPLYEAPKNIFSIFFVFLGGWVAFRHQHALGFFSRGDPAAWALLLLAISPFFAGIGSPFMGSGERLSSALNWSLMPLGALVFLLFNVSGNQLVWVVRVLCVGTVVAVTHGFAQWTRGYPELNSVGHVNQSALYLAFSLVPTGLLFVNRQHILDLLLVLASLVAVFWYLGPSRSLVGFGAALIVVAGLWLIVCVQRGWVRSLIGSVCLGVVLSVVVVDIPANYFGSYEAMKKELNYRLGSKKNPYSKRDLLFNSAVEVAGDSLFGYGLGSFGQAASMKNVKASVVERGRNWKAERKNYFSSSHGHSIFANVLVERGWFGVGSVGIFLMVILGVFLRHIRQTECQVGALTILVIFIAGLGQSTLHVEHGQLALICLALCLKLGLMGREGGVGALDRPS